MAMLASALLYAMFDTAYGSPAQTVISVLLTLVLGVGGLYIRGMVSQLTSISTNMNIMQADVNTKLGVIQNDITSLKQSSQEFLRRLEACEERQFQLEQNIGENNEKLVEVNTRLDMHLDRHREE